MIIRLTAAAVTVATALLSLPAVAADAPLKLTVPPGQTVTIGAVPDGTQIAPKQSPDNAQPTQAAAPANPPAGRSQQNPSTFQLTIRVGYSSQVCLPDCRIVEPGVPLTLIITADTLNEGLKFVRLDKSNQNHALVGDDYMIISVNNGPPAFMKYNTISAEKKFDERGAYPPFSSYLPPAVLAQFKAPSC